MSEWDSTVETVNGLDATPPMPAPVVRTMRRSALRPASSRRRLYADALEQARRTPTASPRDDAAWAVAIHGALERAERPSLRRVINATGVVLHTNLGRAPLAAAALDARYARGARGRRHRELPRGARRVEPAPARVPPATRRGLSKPIAGLA